MGIFYPSSTSSLGNKYPLQEYWFSVFPAGLSHPTNTQKIRGRHEAPSAVKQRISLIEFSSICITKLPPLPHQVLRIQAGVRHDLFRESLNLVLMEQKTRSSSRSHDGGRILGSPHGVRHFLSQDIWPSPCWSKFIGLQGPIISN